MTPDEARRELGAFLTETGTTQRALARAVGVSEPTVHDWLSGSRRPREVHRQSIETFTGGRVRAGAWDAAEPAATGTEG